MLTKDENRNVKQNKKQNITKTKISIYRLLEYFVIYSFLGYILETIYAIVVCGKLECRQSFLYGPFCSIYGLGAAIMILLLHNLKNKRYKLFVGRNDSRINC